MSSMRYFAECEVQNGDSYCFLIVISFHVLLVEAPCTGRETICIRVHESLSPSMLISMWDYWFTHHINTWLENPHSVKCVCPVESSGLTGCHFTKNCARGKCHLKQSPSPISIPGCSLLVCVTSHFMLGLHELRTLQLCFLPGLL